MIQDREGNEFVWVPIDSVSTGTSKLADDIRLGRYTFNETNGTPKKEQDADDYDKLTSINSIGDYNYQELIDSSTNTPAKNLRDFVTKTQENGGYYIGRYEASQGIDGKARSQYNKKIWNFITQPNSAVAAREMYDNNYMDSDLINSYSWDTAIVFIQKYSGNSNYANRTSINNNGIINAGKSGDKVCNIYDMASNCMEWTTEHSEPTPCVTRGGHCNGEGRYVGKRSYHGSTSATNDIFAFRILVYLK